MKNEIILYRPDELAEHIEVRIDEVVVANFAITTSLKDIEKKRFVLTTFESGSAGTMIKSMEGLV